jgi:hypothetical protein
MEVELSGSKKFSKPVYLLPADSYEADLVHISDIYETEKWNSDELVKKITFEFKLGLKPMDYLKNKAELEKMPEELRLTLFVNAKVTKGSQYGKKIYKNSMMYDILEIGGLLDDFKKFYPSMKTLAEPDAEAKFVGFLKEKMLNKKVKILVDTVKGQKGEYSVVKKINRFVVADLKNIK